jgi:uncharacterized protein YndB with AHSA1/START domain
MTDRIEKAIELSAPLARVWRALTDHKEFGIWFRVELEGPFVVGQISRGRTTYPGYEGMRWEAMIVAMEPERLFAFKWCPYEHDDDRDLSQMPHTLVEFRIEPTSTGTRLVISESGFDALPDDKRRLDALRSNTQGWEEQMRSLAAYAET